MTGVDEELLGEPSIGFLCLDPSGTSSGSIHLRNTDETRANTAITSGFSHTNDPQDVRASPLSSALSVHLEFSFSPPIVSHSRFNQHLYPDHGDASDSFTPPNPSIREFIQPIADFSPVTVLMAPALAHCEPSLSVHSPENAKAGATGKIKRYVSLVNTFDDSPRTTLKKVEVGNNKTGRRGKLRCVRCRKRNSKVHST